MRLLLPARSPAFLPVWLGWVFLAIQVGGNIGGNAIIVDVYWGLVAALAAVAAIVSVRCPVVAAGFIMAALVLNAVSPDNVVSGLYATLLWIPVTVGAKLGAHPLIWVVLGQLSYWSSGRAWWTHSLSLGERPSCSCCSGPPDSPECSQGTIGEPRRASGRR